MKELLEKNGWTLYSHCSCDGSYKETYINKSRFPEYKIFLRPHRKQFELTRYNTGVAKGKEDIFEQTLKDNGLIK